MKAKPVLPPTCLLAALVVMPVVHFLFPVTKIFPLPWNLIGLLPLVAGIAINILADGALHKAGTTVKPYQVSTALVTHNVYRFSRHPMYLGFVLILAGAAMLLGTLSPWIIIPLFMILMEIVFIRREESMMAENFGAAWTAYKKKVRRWV